MVLIKALQTEALVSYEFITMTDLIAIRILFVQRTKLTFYYVHNTK